MAYRAPNPAILSIGTSVPCYKAKQTDVAEWMAASLANHPGQARLMRMVSANSGVETRHSCINDYFLPPDESRFAPGVSAERSPSTAERMAIFEREAAPLGAEAAQQAFAAYATKSGVSSTEIRKRVTHIIVATCTGFFAPGLDVVLAQLLQLPHTIDRTQIGFMGCSAMFNALRLADQIVKANTDALVLVVSVELCSLHSQPDPLTDQLVGASFFADGASAALVGSPTESEGDYFTLSQFHTGMKPDTETEMVWQIGNYGFALRLSPRIPEHLAEAAPANLKILFPTTTPEFWAIHPGGSAIVDRLAKSFKLEEEHVAASRAVLRDYGNMSSATILFVLAELQRTFNTSASTHKTGVAMAFGPGLVIEMARIDYTPPSVSSQNAATLASNQAQLLQQESV